MLKYIHVSVIQINVPINNNGVDTGSPFRGPIDVALSKKYMPLVSERLKTKYCNRKGEQAQLIH